jgi:hypothetical protein
MGVTRLITVVILAISCNLTYNDSDKICHSVLYPFQFFVHVTSVKMEEHVWVLMSVNVLKVSMATVVINRVSIR